MKALSISKCFFMWDRGENMSDSVGKISLDLEVKSDLGKQISSMSELIAKNLKSSLNAGTKTMFDSMKNSANDSIKSLDSGIKSTLNKMRNNLKNTMKSVFSSVKKIKMPSFSPVENITSKSVNIPKSNTNRGPPINNEVLTSQIQNTAAELDNINTRIEQQREKLAQLKESFTNTFNQNTKNKINEQILKTEASIIKLINKSDILGFKLADLDSKLAMSSTNTANTNIKELGSSTSKTGARASNSSSQFKKLYNALNSLGIGSKKANSSLNSTTNQLRMMFKSMITWGMIFPMIIKGITAMATGLFNNLKTNEQFSNSLAQIKSNLMIAFTPIYNAILPAINVLMSALSTLSQYIASFTSAIFGKTFNQSKQATQGLINAKQAMGAYGDAAKKTGKDIKDSLGVASFDEINSLNSQSDSGDDSSGGASGAPELVSPELETSNVDSKMNEFAEKVKRVFATIFQPFKNAWAKDGLGVISEVKRSIEGTKETFKNFYRVLETPPVQLFIENIARIGLALVKLALAVYNEFILPIVNWFISILPSAANGLNPILNAVRRFIDYLASNGEVLRIVCSLILGLVVAFKSLEIGIQVVKWIKGITDVLTILAANPIILVIAGIVALIAVFIALYASSETFRNKVNELGATIIKFVSPAFNFLKEKVLEVWNKAIIPFGSALIDFGKTVLIPLANILKDILVSAFNTVIEIIKILWNNVLKPLVNFIVNTFIKAIQGLIEVWNAWKPYIQAIIDIILYLWNTVLKPLVSFIIGAFLEAFKSVFTSIGNIIGNLKQIFGGIIDFIVGVFTGNWKKAWQGVVDIFAGIMKGLGNVIKGPLNAVISMINSAIEGINNISVDIPDWVPGFGGKTFGMNIPKIPMLAKGGVIDSPTLAMVGEAGKEAVVPLENNTGWKDEIGSMVANAVLSAMQFNGNSNNSSNGDIYLQIDGTTFARVINPYIDKEDKRKGNNMIIKTV